MRPRWTLMMGALLALASCVSNAPAGSSAANTESEGVSHYYYSGGEKVPLRVETGQVGVLLKADYDPAEFRSRMESLATETAIEEYPGGFLVLTGIEPTTSDSAAVARQVVQSEAVARSGLVVRLEGVSDPMILSKDFIAVFKPGVSRAQIESFNASQGVEIVWADPAENRFLLAIGSGSELEALATANRYNASELVEQAHPNFTRVVREREGQDRQRR